MVLALLQVVRECCCIEIATLLPNLIMPFSLNDASSTSSLLQLLAFVFISLAKIERKECFQDPFLYVFGFFHR